MIFVARTDPSPRLCVHLFGDHQGESIVLEMPDGQWGVLDCFSPTSNPEFNPIAGFLRSNAVKRLEFVCMTHPHRDHYRGMSRLLTEFEVAEFWRPSVLFGQELSRIIDLATERALRDPTNEAEADALELVEIFTRISQMRIPRSGALPIRPAVANTPLLLVKPHFKITALSPSGRQIDKYHTKLRGSFDHNGKVKNQLPAMMHNLISLAVLVEFGNARLLFGADLEKEGWMDVLGDSLSPLNDGKPTHFVKVSHHGSDNGYCDRLWENLAAKVPPIAALTAFCSNKLPKRSAIDHICTFAAGHRIATPNLSAAEAAASVVHSRAPSGSNLSRETLNKKTGAKPASVGPMGRCSFEFAADGKCIARNFSSDAGWLS